MAFFRLNVLIFLLLTLVLYSNAAVPSDAVCQRLAPQVALVKSNVRAPNRFCKFFLSRARERTPIPGIKASELTQACACIFKQARKVQPQLITTPITEIPGTRYRCNNDFALTIKAAFVNWNAFCNFFVAAIRDDSPFENLNAMQVKRDCTCIIDARKSSISSSTTVLRGSSTTSRTTSTSKSVTTRRSSTSTTRSSSSSTSSKTTTRMNTIATSTRPSSTTTTTSTTTFTTTTTIRMTSTTTTAVTTSTTTTATTTNGPSCASPTANLVPVANSNIDTQSLSRLNLSDSITLFYAQSAPGNLAASVKLDMYYPAIDIATTSLLQSYTCSDSTLTLQLASSRKEAIRKILAWPKQNIVLITQDAACNKPGERGVFLTESSSASAEGGITKIAFNVKTSKWSDVAEKMDISYGTRTGNEGTPSDLQPSCASTYQHSGTAPTTSPNVGSTYQNLSPRAKALVDYAVGKLRYAANGNILVAPTNFTQPAIKSAPWTPNDKAAQDDLEAKLLSAGLDDPASFKKAADAAISGTCPVTSVTKQTQTVLRTSQGLRKRFEFGDLVDVACDTFAGDIFGTAGDAACAGKDLYDNQDAWACLFTGCFKSQYDPPTYQFDFEASWFASYGFPQNTEVVTFSDGSKINCIDCSLDISEIKLAGHISVILATNKVVEANIAVSENSKASMVLNLNAVQSLNYQWKTAVTSLPMDPLTVSGFFSIEPTVIFSLGAEVSTTAAVNIEAGARMEWEEASASIDLTNRAVSDIKGWQPKIDVTFPTFSLRGGVKVYPFIRRLYKIKFSILGSELSETATFTSQTAIGFDAETLDESKGLCSMDDMRLLSYVSNKQNVVFGNRAIQTLNERSVAQPEKCYKVPSNKPTAEEIQTLRSVGQEFCTSYIAYDPPVVGVYTTGIISTVTITEERTTVEIQTSPTVFTTYPVTIDIFKTISTVTTTTDAAAGTITLDAQYQKRGLDLSAATTAAASQDHPRAPMITTSAASTAEPLDKRDIATPDLVATWAQSKIFFACSQVATGSTTVTFTTAYQTQYTSTATSTNTFYTMVNGGIITKRVYTTLSAWNTIPTYTSTRTLDASCPLQTQASCFNIKGAGVPRVAGRALGLANEVAQASFNAPATAFYLACDGSLISLPDHRTLSISSGLLDFVSHEATTQGSRIKCEKVTASKELKCTNPAGGDVIYVWDPESSYLNETFFQVTPLIDPRLWTPSFAAGSPSSEYHPVTLTYEPVTCPCGTPEPVTDLAIFDPKNLACPAADGYTYKTADGVLWQIQCNTNYPDNDITTATASSLVSCIDSCDTDIQCIVATWVASTQLCTLKSDVPIYSSLVQSPLKTHAVVRLSKIAPPRQLLVNPTFSVGRGQWSASINNLRLDGWTATPGVSWESANQQYSVPAPIHALLNGRFGSGYRFTDVSISQTVSGLTVGKWYRFSTDVWWFSYFGSAYVSYYVDNQQLFRSNAIPERVAAEHVGVNGPYAFQATATSHTWKILYQNSCDTCTGDSTSGWVSVFSATLMGPYSSASQSL